MLITVAICSLNHAELLRRTLQSLAALQVPHDLGWEVVVVNNGSTDHTDQVLAAFADRLPLRCEVEPERGLSRARNRAVDTARGDYMVWTDDDVVVGPGSARRLCERHSGTIRTRSGVRRPGLPTLRTTGTRSGSWNVRRSYRAYSPIGFRHRDEREASVFGRRQGLLRALRCPNFAAVTAEQRGARYDLRLGMAPGQKRRGRSWMYF